MAIRPLFLLVSLLLSGCSTLSSFSWSSLWPTHWFSSSPTVSEQGVGKITAATPMVQSEIAALLPADYQLRSGMQTHNGKVEMFYQVMQGNQIKLLIVGQPKGLVQRVEVMDATISSGKNVTVGATFSSLYSQAYPACVRAPGEGVQVICKAADSLNISYVFSGKWRGPQDLMPSDDALKSWTLSKIIWQSASAQ
jgi:hypothetical protein